MGYPGARYQQVFELDHHYAQTDLPEIDALLARLRSTRDGDPAYWRPALALVRALTGEVDNGAMEDALGYVESIIEDEVVDPAGLLDEAIKLLESERERIVEDVEMNPWEYEVDYD